MKSGAHSIHRPLVPSAIVYAIGTVVGAAIASSIAGWIALPVSVVFLMASLRFRRLRFALVLSCLFAFAFFRSALSESERRQATREFVGYADREEPVTVSGEVISVRPGRMARNGRVCHKFSLKDAAFRERGDKRPLPDPVRVSWYASENLAGGTLPTAGERMEVHGNVFRKRAAEEGGARLDDVYVVSSSSSSRILAKTGDFQTALAGFRDRAAALLSAGLDARPEERELILAMTLGLRSDLPKSLTKAFRRAGTIHIFAISGLHVGVIAVLLVHLLSFAGVSRTYVVLPLAPLLMAYVVMTGLQPSALRAALMVTIYYSALLFGRRPDLLGALALTLLVILVVHPLQIFEIGLILSFCMVGGIIVFTGPVHMLCRRFLFNPAAAAERRLAILAEQSGDPDARVDRWPRDGLVVMWNHFLSIFAAALAAALVSFPLTAHIFGVLTPYSLLANVVVVPLAGPVMGVAGAGLFVSLLVPGFAPAANAVASWFAWAMKAVSQAVASLPGAAVEVSFPLWALALWYVVLAALLRGIPGFSKPLLNVSAEGDAT